MQIDSMRKYILTAIKIGFQEICITTVRTTNFSDIDTPIPETEKCVGECKKIREFQLEQEAFVEGNNMTLLMVIEK